MHIDWKTLQRAETGRTAPFPSTALKIAGYYGLRVTDVWPLAGAGRTTGRSDAPSPSGASVPSAAGGSPGAGAGARS